MGLTQAQNAVSIIRGSTKTFELTVVDVAKAAVNITGARVLFSVKRFVTDEHALIQKDSAKGVAEIELTEPKAGKAQIKIDPSDTQTMDVGEYIFDVWVVLTNGNRHPVVPPSTFEVKAGVTVIAT
jgi:hypothetical protein